MHLCVLRSILHDLRNHVRVGDCSEGHRSEKIIRVPILRCSYDHSVRVSQEQRIFEKSYRFVCVCCLRHQGHSEQLLSAAGFNAGRKVIMLAITCSENVRSALPCIDSHGRIDHDNYRIPAILCNRSIEKTAISQLYVSRRGLNDGRST